MRQAIVDTFVEHESRSLQYTLHAIAEAVLDRYADIAEIHLWVPNRECRVVDLSQFGLENNNEVFAPGRRAVRDDRSALAARDDRLKS